MGGAPASGGNTTTGGGGGTTGGAVGAGGEPVGMGGARAPLDAPWDSLYGHYDLFVVPEDTECDGLKGHLNFSLREGDSGPEARIFRNFEWNGWPDELVEDAQNSGIWLRPGAGASLDEAVAEAGVFLPYDEEGFVMPGIPSGSTIVRSTCGDATVEQPAVVSIRLDQTSPHIREYLTTRYNFYPFTWMMFEFSEPLGFTTDSYPWGSFTTLEEGAALLEMRGSLASTAPGRFEQWPWGPVVGMTLTDPAYRRGGSVWVTLVGEEFDAAGNELVTDASIYGVVDLGPLEARHDFDAEPPLLGFSHAEYLAPGESDLCESGGGCVLISQVPGNCDLEGNLVGSAPQQFAFQVGGPDVPGGLMTGVRLRYRQVSMEESPFWGNALFAQSGVADYEEPLEPVEELPQPVEGWTHASPWSEMVIPSLLPTDEFGLVLSWECPYGMQPHRAIVLEWVEATVP